LKRKNVLFPSIRNDLFTYKKKKPPINLVFTPDYSINREKIKKKEVIKITVFKNNSYMI